MSTKNICIFGDSIAYGEWTHHLGWADQLQNVLQQRTIESGFSRYYFLYNLSIPGNTTEDVLKRFRVEARARGSHIIICAVGTNDVSCRDNPDVPRVSPEKFKENIRMLMSEAKHCARAVVWIGLTRVDEKRTTPFETTYFANERIRAYDAMIRKACAEWGVLYLELFPVLQPDDLEDGLHPNKQGHEKLFRVVHDFLIEQKVI